MQANRACHAAGAGLQLPGNQTCEHAFANTFAPNDRGWLIIESQVQFFEQGCAIGELKAQLIQGNECGCTQDVSHRHLQKMS